MVLFDFAEGISNHVKKLFNPSDVQIGNFVFTLQQKWTFVIIIIGLIFSASNNYLNKEAIICHGGSSFHNHYCFLHGSSHIPKKLQAQVSSSTSCIRDDGKDPEEVRTTHYYIWLPFVLAIIAILTKLPGVLWKNLLERGMMKNLVEDMDEDGSKTAKRFLRVMRRGKTLGTQTRIYNFGFAFCEILNLIVILISLSILNSLFNGEFSSYGINVHTHNSFVYNPKLPERTNPLADPMCHLFPTEVSCTVKTGGIGGNANKDNTICLLPNNAFYQYYFLILWWWWVGLIFISCFGLVYRLVQILVPQFGRMRLVAMFDSLGLHPKLLDQFGEMELSTWETFLLTRLVRNLKGSQVTKLFEALDKEGMRKKTDDEEENEEEGQTLINHEDLEQNNTEMTVVIDNVTD